MIIFYDGNCPLCVKEMDSLKRADTHNKIILEDINKDDFEQQKKNKQQSTKIAGKEQKKTN
eukprot:GDKH01024116.1.p1 GENE.GDKH01024116.1~~GDKH01024116.1.p1  ORF type:complete len:61 (+),score=13.54 GDKH01024116.1:103-285(+)